MNIKAKLQAFFSQINGILAGLGEPLLKILKRHNRKEDEKARLIMLRTVCEISLFPGLFDVLYQGKVNRPPARPELLFKMLVAKEVLGIKTDRRLIEDIRDREEIREILGFREGEAVPCRATLSRFRSKLRDHYRRTGEDLMEKTINSLIQAFQFTDTELDEHVVFRIDSTMVDSLLRESNRIELFYLTIRAFVNDLERLDLPIPWALAHHLDKGEFNTWFYRKRKENMEDLLWFCLFKDIEVILGMNEAVCAQSGYFEILKRLIDEQTCLDEDGVRVLREASEIPSNSLQSPFDPEATYRYKKGAHIGYVVNFVEMLVLDEKDKIKARSIVYFQLEQNIYSDIQFLKDFLARYPKTGGVHRLVCDGAYYSDETRQLALAAGFELVPTALTGKQPEEFMAGFKLNSEGTRLLSCPGGCVPKSQSYSKSNDSIRASFKIEVCENCPEKAKCHPDPKKRVAVKMVSRKGVDRANVLKEMGSKEYMKLANIRNGIESIPSQLKKRYQVNENRHRGVFGAGMDTGLKILSLALTKLTNAWVEFGLPDFDFDSCIV